LLLLFILTASFHNHLESLHRKEITGLETAKLDLTYTHLQLEDSIGNLYNSMPAPHSLGLSSAKTILQDLAEFKCSNWFVLPLCSNLQKNEIRDILKKLNDFEKLSNIQLISSKNKIEQDATYIIIIEKINKLQSDLTQRLSSQVGTINNIQIILLILFMAYVFASFWLIIKYRKGRKKNISFISKANYYLNESQKLANIGSFNLDLKTENFTSSFVFDKITEITESALKNFDTWHSIVHPDDLAKNIKMFENCIKSKSRFNRVYRIISYREKNEKWIRGLGIFEYNGDTPISFIGTIQDITEQKKAELKLKEQDQKLLEAQKIAKLGFYNLDFTTNTFTSSAICDQIVGVKSSDVKTRELFHSPVHPEDRMINQKLIDQCIKTGDNFENEYRILTLDTKELKWLKGVGEINFKDGEPTNLVGIIQDITQRKLIELNLKQNKKQLLETNEIAQLGSFSFDDISNTFESSDIFDSIVGIDSSYTKNHENWKKLAHPDDLIWIQQLFRDSDQENISCEFRIVRPCDKKTIWVQIHANKKFDQQGERYKFNGSLQDITERKLAEKNLLEYGKIIEESLNEIYILDVETLKFINVNKGGRDNLGYSLAELKNMTPLDITIDWDVEKFKKDIVHVMDGKNSVLEFVSEHRRKDGSFYSASIHIQKKEFDAKPVFVAFVSDITKRLKNNKDLKLKNEELNLISQKLSIKNQLLLESQEDFKDLFELSPVSLWEEDFSKVKELLDNIKPATKNLKKYLDENPDFVYKCISALDILNVNSVSLQLFGINNKEGLIEHLEKTFNEKSLEVFKNELLVIANNKKEYSTETEFIKSDGTIINTILKLAVDYDHKKAIVSIVDVSQKYREEQINKVIYSITKKANGTLNLNTLSNFIRKELGKLINTENFFIALYNEKTEMITTPYMVDSHELLTVFPKGETLTGYVIENKKSLLTREVIFKDPNKKVVVGLGPESKCWLGVPLLIKNKAIGAIVVQSYTDENAYTDNDVLLLEFVAANISQVINRINDIEQINLLNQAMVQNSESIIITNKNGEIEFTNPAFTKLSGFSKEEVLGKNPRVLKSGHQSDKFYKQLWHTLSKGQIWEGEFVNVKKDGTNYLVNCNITPVKNKEGEITHYIGTQLDITEKRKLERNFIHAFIDAQEIEKQNFGEELHDGISQILSAEGMYIDILIQQHKNNSNGESEYLNKIKNLNLNATNEARSIAHGLMSKQLKKDGLIKAIQHICLDYTSTKHIDFSFSNRVLKEEDVKNEIKTNIFRITQEISTNIIRHSGATKASVKLSKSAGNNLKLVVTDNGVGIDFDQLKEKRKGAGLKNIERRVIILNGKLKTETKPNQGTIFTIEVPLTSLQ
jgi:PAS domain S-box-containing protein